MRLPNHLNDHLTEFKKEWRQWPGDRPPPSFAARWDAARARGPAFPTAEWDCFWYKLLCSDIYYRQSRNLAPADTYGNPEIGGFRLLHVIGWGGMGVVFKAHQISLGRPVAFKVMLANRAEDEGDALARFRREAKTAAKVHNKHVVVIHDVSGESHPVPFIAMEYLEGQSLKDRLKASGKMEWREAARIGLAIAKGLQAAHVKGLMHRDMKPGNVFLEAPRDHVKILDFGLARLIQDADGLTRSGVIMGTPAYMAPEHASGSEVDNRCDLFSLGAVLYEILAGKPPFHGRNELEVLHAVRYTEPEVLGAVVADLPEPLGELVTRLLSKDPQNRPKASQVIGILESLLQEGAPASASLAGQAEPTAVGPDVPPEQQARPRPRDEGVSETDEASAGQDDEPVTPLATFFEALRAVAPATEELERSWRVMKGSLMARRFKQAIVEFKHAWGQIENHETRDAIWRAFLTYLIDTGRSAEAAAIFDSGVQLLIPSSREEAQPSIHLLSAEEGLWVIKSPVVSPEPGDLRQLDKDAARGPSVAILASRFPEFLDVAKMLKPYRNLALLCVDYHWGSPYNADRFLHDLGFFHCIHCLPIFCDALPRSDEVTEIGCAPVSLRIGHFVHVGKEVLGNLLALLDEHTERTARMTLQELAESMEGYAPNKKDVAFYVLSFTYEGRTTLHPAVALQRRVYRAAPTQLYVANLTYYRVNETELRALFSPYGPVQSAEVGRDADGMQNPGIGFVEMATEQQARAAVQGLHKKPFKGRRLDVKINRMDRRRWT